MEYIRGEADGVARVLSSPLFDVMAPSRQSLRVKLMGLMEGAIIYGNNGQRVEVYGTILVSQVNLLVREGEEIRNLGDGAVLSGDKWREWLEAYEGNPGDAIVRIIPSDEKRAREDKFNSFAVPSWIGRLLSHYIIRMRPQLAHRAEQASKRSPQELLLHTESGSPIGRESMRKTLVYFAQQALGESCQWEPSFQTLRSSIATMQYLKWSRSTARDRLSRAEFLEKLAGVMNTSVGQLEEHYIASYGDVYLERQLEFEEGLMED